jgi:hypothetical protein
MTPVTLTRKIKLSKLALRSIEVKKIIARIRLQIRIWIGIKIESLIRIQIRIDPQHRPRLRVYGSTVIQFCAS